ncbi:MAG: 50S ribosomal protein L25 [Candidatus Pacebacteria bacterium]|nr:50S ribosomal protein L25 [Candidatus Paceibacterota bacterium]
MLILKANKRAGEKMVDIRAEGLVPAVFYGFKKEATSISVPSVDFIKLFREAGETTAITLDVAGEKISTLIHDVQRDPVTGAPVHVDFLVVDMNKITEVSVPLEFSGISEAEKSGIGMVVKVMHEITVSALPADLPHSIHVDVSSLATLSDAIHAKDVVLPKGVTLVDDAEEVVAAVTGFAEEKEEAPVLDVDAIEVEKKGKKEEEAEPAE